MNHSIWQTIKKREFSIVLFIIAFVLLIGSFNNACLTGETLSLLLKASVILIVLAIGQSFVLLTAHIDVSVGSIMGLAAAVCGVLLTSSVSVIWVFLIVILLGAIIGFVNGLGVTFGRIPSIIMTLGMLGIIRGCMILYTKGMWIEDIPYFYKQLANVKMFGLTLPFWLAILLMLITHLFLKKTKFGQYFYAVGDNSKGAELVGIPIRKVTILAFIFSGISASLAGLIFVMNIGFVPNQTGSGIELQVIAAAVLGGVSLTGGLGTIVGATFGAIFFTIINSSLIYLKIPAYYNNAVSGLLLLMIVVGDSKLQRLFKKRTASPRSKGGDTDESDPTAPS